MRPIDADVLYQKTEKLEKQAREASRQAITEPTQEKWNTILAERSAFKYDITQMPTIDAVPVVHGEWIEENRRPKSGKFYCSVCHRDCYDIQPSRVTGWKKRCRYSYCPNCGAKMDGERKDDV